MNKSKRGKRRQKRKLNKEKIDNKVNYINLDDIVLYQTENDYIENHTLDLYTIFYYIKDDEYFIDLLNKLQNFKNINLIKEKYDENDIFDFGIKYQLMALNEYKQKGKCIIKTGTPEIFKNINETELIEKLDKLSGLLTNNEISKFKIGKQTFYAKFLGNGANNNVFVIYDKKKHEICFRINNNILNTNCNSYIFNEFFIGIYGNKSGVSNIPKFYMANPVAKFVQGHKICGSWSLVEYIDKNTTKLFKKDLDIFDWLDSKNLKYVDIKSSQFVNNYFVDFGTVFKKNEKENGYADYNLFNMLILNNFDITQFSQFLQILKKDHYNKNLLEGKSFFNKNAGEKHLNYEVIKINYHYKNLKESCYELAAKLNLQKPKTLNEIFKLGDYAEILLKYKSDIFNWNIDSLANEYKLIYTTYGSLSVKEMKNLKGCNILNLYLYNKEKPDYMQSAKDLKILKEMKDNKFLNINIKPDDIKHLKYKTKAFIGDFISAIESCCNLLKINLEEVFNKSAYDIDLLEIVKYFGYIEDF